MRHIVISDCERPEQTVPIARAYGVGLECTTFYDPNFLPEHPGGIEDYLRTTEGISFKTMHGPFAGLSTGVRDRQIRAVTMGRYLEACGTAHALGLRDIVIHNNYYDYCAPRDVWRQNTRDFFRELLERIQGRDVCFHLENTLERDGELIAEVVSSAASPKLDMCLDVGHAQGMVRDGLPALDWVERYGGMIGHVHLHNNCGLRDDHNNLADGVIPMAEVLQALEDRAPGAIWCIECGLPRHDVRASLDYLASLGYLKTKGAGI